MFDIDVSDFIDIPNSTGNSDIDAMLTTSPKRLNNPILSIDGKMLAIKNCKIDPSFEIKEADISGQTSSTAKAKQGNKGAVLNVTGLIPFKDPTTLTSIFALSRAVDSKGNAKVYVIGCDTAKALKIRRVSFTGKVSAPQHSNLRAWSISFTLREHISANELAEKQSIQQTDTESLVEATAPKGLVTTSGELSVDTILDALQKEIKEQLK